MTADQLAMLQEQGKTPENLPRYKHRLGERSMRTAELHAAVLRLAAERRLQVIHGVPRMMLARGWPDVVVVGPGGVLFRKLTDEHSRLHLNSAAMLDYLYRGYADAGVWRPQDLHDGTIEAELDQICGEAAVVYLVCQDCHQPVVRTGRSQKRCPECAVAAKNKLNLGYWRARQQP